MNAPPGDTPPVLSLSPPRITPLGLFFVAFSRGEKTLCYTKLSLFRLIDPDITG